MREVIFRGIVYGGGHRMTSLNKQTDPIDVFEVPLVLQHDFHSKLYFLSGV